MENQESSIRPQQYGLMLKRQWLPASLVFGSVFALTLLSLLLQKPIYEAQGQILYKKTSPISSYTGVGKEVGELDALQQQGNPVDTEAVVILSVPNTQETITRLELKDKSGAPLKRNQFLKQLKVISVKGTDVLQISYRDVDSKRAAAVVNTLMTIYLEGNLLANRTAAGGARKFIEKQLPQAEASVRQADLALRRFKEQNKVVALDEEAKSAVAITADLQRQVNSTQTQLADAQRQSAVLKNQLNKDLQQAVSASVISQSPGVQEVLKEVQQLESQLAIERSRFREDSPTVVFLKNRKAYLDRLLQKRVRGVFGGQRQNFQGGLQSSQFEQKLTEKLVESESRRLGLSSQLAALFKVWDAYRQRIDTLPQLEQKQRELERQLQASQATYSLLLQKLQEARIAENQNVSNARVISSAWVAEDPVAPRKGVYIITGILLGSILAVATVWILETQDKSIKTVDQAREVFGFTLLGVIPTFKEAEKISDRDQDLEQSAPEIVVRDSPQSPFSEAYQMLQANLKFLSSDQLKVIVVTSCLPKEGKSTVSANLAVAMAQVGRKVLLVDADMRRPMQHHIWELPNQLGLSNLIVGQGEARTALKEVMPNLHVLTAGVTPPNPIALLDSQRMASLVEVFSANHDFVIIDTPALGVAADAPIVGKIADGVLLVVRPGVVDTASATYAKEFLEKSGQKVLGQVINGVIPKNEPYSYYYFSNQYSAKVSVTKSANSSPKS
jgi:capsular exopolysaccharide synthesis family protein